MGCMSLLLCVPAPSQHVSTHACPKHVMGIEQETYHM